jgi:hypothetical protein
MKSGWLKWLRNIDPNWKSNVSPDTDFTGVFAIPDNEPWWLAVHQILNEAEAETTSGARNRTANPNLCIAAVGAGEGVELVRQKLLDKRRVALLNMQREVK